MFHVKHFNRIKQVPCLLLYAIEKSEAVLQQSERVNYFCSKVVWILYG